VLSRANEVALKSGLALKVTGNGYFDWKTYKDFSHGKHIKQYYFKITE
jgi:hypothetical protein